MEKKGLLVIIFFAAILLFSFLNNNVSAQTYASCAAVPAGVLNGKPCVQVSSCGTIGASNTYYLLVNNIVSDATCIMMDGDNSVFDLNDLSITFGNVAYVGLPNSEFESWSGGLPTSWNLTGVTGTLQQRSTSTDHAGWGNSILGWTPSGLSEYLYSSFITLPSAGKYLGNAMFNIGGLSGSPAPVVTVENNLGQTLCTSTGNAGLPRGINCEFITTGSTTVRLKITLNSGTSGIMYLDEADIRATESYGIVAASFLHATPFNGLTGGGASNATIKNGYIIQGQGKGYFGAAISPFVLSPFGEIYNITSSVSGPSTHHLYSEYGTSNGLGLIHDNVFNSNNQYVLARDREGGHIHLVSGIRGTFKFYNNQLIGGVGGFWISGPSTYLTDPDDIQIYNNTVKSNGTDSNQYSISFWSLRNVKVYDNKVIPYSGEGIKSEQTDNVQIYNNFINFSSMSCNFEYPTRYKSLGIRVRDYSLSGPTSNHLVYNNVIIGRTIPGQTFCTPSTGGIYVSNYIFPASVNNTFINNTVNMSTTNSNHDSIGLLFSAENNNFSDVFINNTVQSNNQIVRLGFDNGQGSKVVFDSNKFIKGPNPLNFATVRLGYCCGYIGDGIFTDTSFSGGAGFDLANTVFSQTGSALLNMTVKWYLNTLVLDGTAPVSGANVIVRDSTNSLVFSGITDVNGKVKSTVTDFYRYQTTGGGAINQVNFNPYTVNVSKVGYPTNISIVTINQSKTHIVYLAGGAICGNGIVEGAEQCDGANLNGQSCVSQGFSGGTLSCTGSCTFNTSLCTVPTCGDLSCNGGETCSTCPGDCGVCSGATKDVNNDGKVNIIDYSIVTFNQGRNSGNGDWLNYDHLDLNSDGKVDFTDVLIVFA